MKQIAKTEAINGKLRAAYGPDADLSNLAVYECIALTTLPIRKASGIFQGARNSLSLLSEIGAAINAESAPLQVQHDTSDAPFGRTFYAEMMSDELRSLFAVDAGSHPEIITKLDNGTIDQVSVSFAPKAIKCSACGFDFLGVGNELSLWTLTCDEDHVIGQNGVFAHVDGLKQFFELSLVGKGGAQGARIVGPSDAQLQRNEQFRLAASATPGLFALSLSPTTKDPNEMNAEQMAAYSAAIASGATATAQLTAVQAELNTATATITALTATIAERDTQLAAAVSAAAEAVTHKANHDAAVAALTTEATVILTALKKPVENIPTDVAALTALIAENRAAFAAAVPVGGLSLSATQDQSLAPAPSNAAFRAPR